ncbi:tetratricopeptide repeat protein [Novosphingobium sp. BL-52-GroH]|uniref:tetratricopeptide repeat protein n=1 Tax=Novosphingobium sp. BL-52-GroH TaxID=3349877 RepID=UPI0038501F98
MIGAEQAEKYASADPKATQKPGATINRFRVGSPILARRANSTPYFRDMLIPLLLAAATSQISVRVAPADPTAFFMGDGAALKLDPACRDYTVDTVLSNPSCAARVAKGEAGPSLAIAATTLASSPDKGAEAIAVLKRSAHASDAPAVHYLIGSMLGTAESMRPDYPTAVAHLTIAAQRGNPAAADLLARLIVAGKGASRDIPRAVRLYETAAANGFPQAAVTLGKLYLAGRLLPKDQERGQAWLDAAAAVDVPGAAQLAALARGQDKITNWQLVPSPVPANVTAVRYGTFDNPDIPPAFGFDQAFRALHDMPFDDGATLARLEKDAATLPTPYLYELARRLAPRDPERGMRTYLLARTRMIYDAGRCVDPAALEAVRAWDMLVLPDLKFLISSGGLSRAAVESALAAEAALPGDTSPWWVCRAGMTAMSEAMAGRPGPLKLKPAGEWPAVRQAARAKISGLVRAK